MSADSVSTAAAAVDSTIDTLDTSDWLALKERGNQKYSAGETTAAISDYVKALAAAPDDASRVTLFGNLALAHLRAGNAAEAVSRCDEGLRISGDNEKLLFRRAKALVQLKDLTAAEAIDRLESAHPGSKGAAELRALLAAEGSQAPTALPGPGPSPRSTNSLRKAMAAAMSSGSLYEDKPQAAPARAGGSGKAGGHGSGVGGFLSACWNALCCRRRAAAPGGAEGTKPKAKAT